MQEINLETAMVGGRIGKPHVKSLITAALSATGYYCGTRIGFALTADPISIPVLWPPNAVLLAGLLLSPTEGWWLILLAVLPAHLAAQWQSGIPLGMALGWFVSNGGEAMLGAICVRSVLGQRLRFCRLRHVVIFLLYCAVLAPLASTFLNVALIRFLGEGQGGLWQLGRLRFFSNVAGILTIAPALLAWNPNSIQALGKMALARKVEGGLLVLALLGICGVVFLSRSQPAVFSPLPLYAPLPILLWAALRFSPLAAGLAFLPFAALAVAVTPTGPGPLAGEAHHGNILSLQLFLIGVSVPLLLLSAAIQERRRPGINTGTAVPGQADRILKEAMEQRDKAVAEQHRAEVEAQQAREQLTHLTRVAALGKLSGALAHELNQPLAAILCNAQAARRSMSQQPVDLHELNEILADIVDEDKRAGEVIRRLRAFFIKGETRVEPLEINELVRDTLAIAHFHLMERKVVATVKLASAPCVVQGDRVQLQQVLLNLIVNACEAMSSNPPGTRRLKLATDICRDGQVQIVVADTGPGIEADVLDKVFDAFFTTKANGMGFGLSISRAIIAEHGGRIEVASNPGGGAVFQITLPAHVGVSYEF